MWAPWQQYLINKIEEIQCRAARYVTSDYDPFNSVTQHISNLRWETLEDCRNKFWLCMFYKMIHKQAAIPYQLYIQCSTYLNSRYSNTMKFLPLSCNKNSYKQLHRCVGVSYSINESTSRRISTLPFAI